MAFEYTASTSHILKLARDGSLIIHNQSTDNTTELSPAIVHALYRFFQQPDISQAIGGEMSVAWHQRAICPLTGLFTRHTMQELLQHELLQATLSGRSVGVIMLDIDQFKQFNEINGFSAGDKLLRVLGAFLQMNVRRGDVACHYDSDEFVLILSGASLGDTCRRAEELRQGARQLQLENERLPNRRITASLGVASFPEHGMNVFDLLQSAQEALLHAKSQGRDCIVVAAPHTPEGATT